MHNWKCTCCGYFTESVRCPSCKYSNCRGCHLMPYMHKPPTSCPACRQDCEFIDIGDELETVVK